MERGIRRILSTLAALLTVCMLAGYVSVAYTPAFAAEAPESIVQAQDDGDSGEPPLTTPSDGETIDDSTATPPPDGETPDDSASTSQLDSETPDDSAVVPQADSESLGDAVSSPRQEPAGEDPASFTDADELLELAAADGRQAALRLNEYMDDEAFLAALRRILDFYYAGEEPNAQLPAFADAVDARADETLAHYAEAADERAQAGLGYLPGEVVVVFKEEVTQTAAEETLAEHDAILTEIANSLPGQTVSVAGIPLEYTVEMAAAELTADPAVDFAEPVYLYHPVEDSTGDQVDTATGLSPASQAVGMNDPFKPSQWHHNAGSGVDTLGAWEQLGAGQAEELLVAVIDTPIDVTHPDLVNNLAMDYYVDFSPDGTAQAPSTPLERIDDHGTHVAGLVAAQANNGIGVAGVASGANTNIVKVMPINVFPNATNRNIAAAVDYAVQKGAAVINLSLGSYSDSLLLETAINAAYAQDVVVVCAAGNFTSGHTLTEPFYPSDYDNVISVISTDQSGARASTSNYGPAKDISAPGVGIYSTIFGSYGSMSGTSMAAPIVSGIAAMMLYANPELAAEEVRTILCDTATPLLDPNTAAGRANAKEAVKAAIAAIDGSDVQALQLSDDDIDLVPNENSQLYTHTRPFYVPVDWTTSDPAIATVDANGVVTGRSDGDVTIAATARSSTLSPLPSAECTVHVLDPSGRPQDFKATDDGSYSSIDLSWKPAASANGYRLYRSANRSVTSATPLYKTFIAGQDDLPDGAFLYSDEDLALDTCYYYKLVAYSNIGQPGEARTGSATREKTTLAKPRIAPPASLTVTSMQDESIGLSWAKVNDADGYVVKKYEVGNTTTPISQNSITSTNWTDAGVAAGTAYKYTVQAVRAVTAYGTSYNINSVASPTAAAIARDTTVKDFRISGRGYNSITLKWSASKDKYVHKYLIYRSTTKDVGYRRITELKPGASSGSVESVTFKDTALAFNKTYYYKIRCVYMPDGDAITGVYTGPVSAKTLVCEPGSPVAKASGCKAVNLSWNKPGGASGYYIYRNTSKDGSYTRIATITSGNTLSYTDKGVSPNKTYYYRIRGYRTVNGVKTNGYVATFPSSAKPLLPAPLGPTIKASNCYTIKLSWAKPSNAKGYYVYRATSKTGSYTLLKTITSATTLAYTDNTAAPGKTYYYKVQTYGTASGKTVKGGTAQLSAKTPVLAAPGSRAAAAAGCKAAKLSWSRPTGASGYYVYRNTSKTGSYTRIATITSPATLNYTDTAVSPNKTYYYKVRAYRKANGTTYNGTVGVFADPVTPLLPAPASAKVAASNCSTVKLSWAKPKNAKGYYIYRTTSANGSFTLIKTLASTESALSYTDQKLTPGKTYYYRIQTYGVAGGKIVKGAAKRLSITTPALAAPANFAAKSAGGDAIRLSWNKTPWASGYVLYRATSKTGTYTEVKAVAGGDTLSWKNTGLTKNKTYYYKIRPYRNINSKRVLGKTSPIISAKPTPA